MQEALGHAIDIGRALASAHAQQPRSDIYSLGICLYEMLIGRPPFRAEHLAAVALKHMNEPLPELRIRRRSGYSPGGTGILARSEVPSPAGLLITDNLVDARSCTHRACR